MNVLDVNEITCQYLYGQDIAPSLKIDDNLIRGGKNTTDVTVDINSYMSTVGRFAFACNSAAITKLFNLQISDLKELKIDQATPGDYVFNKADFAQAFGIEKYGVSYSQWQYDDNTDDYAERVYIWNLGRFQLSDDALFNIRVTEDGGSDRPPTSGPG